MTHPQPVLTTSLEALAANYAYLADKSAGRCGATVKADAYGLGAEQVVHRLARAGCKQFFVATLEEALTLRRLFPSIDLTVYEGLLAGCEGFYRDARITPVLNTLKQVQAWRSCGAPHAAVLHVDTGMSRLGLDPLETSLLCAQPDLLDGAHIGCLMSHLAWADDPTSAENPRQLERFMAVAQVLPDLRLSLANSGGVLLGADYSLDVARPGIALYGGNSGGGIAGPMQPVTTLTAPVLQHRAVSKGHSIGYGGLYRAAEPMYVATIGLGYADGLPRRLASDAYVLASGTRCPIVGRVSMDMIMVDMTHLDDKERLGICEVELLGSISIDQMALWQGTIGYEVLTSLGRRVGRRYI